MIPLFGRQPNEADAVNNNPAINPQRRSLFGRVLNALSPYSAYRSVLNSVVTTPPSMRTPPGTTDIHDIAEINIPSTQALEGELSAWVRGAPRGERRERATAASRVIDCIRQESERLDLSNLRLTSLPENVLKNIQSLRELDISRNNLSVINLSGAQNITNLCCLFNFAVGRSTLDVSNCNNLRGLITRGATLSSLNVNGCNNLRVLNCCTCISLRNLDVSSCTELIALLASHSDLTDLTLPTQVPVMLRTLHLNGTRIRFAQLPEDIRQNQRIHVDIRPVEIVVLPALRGNNHAQNTHTQSVHASASQSATILKNNNQALNIDQAYDQLSAWVNQLPIENAAIEEGYANEAYKNQAAKEWIQHPTHLDHIDPASGISIKEFLALAWTAIHDDAQRDPTALLDDAQESLRDTLYEIKRGYNLSDAHKPTDNGQASVNICAGGTFNKIAEKLVSVVKGASLSMITRETFALSLENTIRKAAMDAVDEDPKLAESLANNEGILTEDIWNAIEGQVSSEVRAEFKAQSHIAGKSIDQLLNEHTQFEGTLEYFEVIPANKAA